MKRKCIVTTLFLLVTFVIVSIWRDVQKESLYSLPYTLSVSVKPYDSKEIHTGVTEQNELKTVAEGLSSNLVQDPEKADELSPRLTTRLEVITEAQRIHKNIFSNIGNYKYVMLFNYVASENKGDSAIGVGEFILLQKMNMEIVFGCEADCSTKTLDRAKTISQKYSNKELVILLHGGGNVIGWPVGDYRRANVIGRFHGFHIVMFPQSILYTGPKLHIEYCKKLYASHKNLTFLWRDRNSYTLGKRLFPKVTSLLSPDIAYQIGHVPRFMSPTHDIMWLKRTDKETPLYSIPEFPPHLTINVSDWLEYRTSTGSSFVEDIYLRTTNGMTFLQRGRVVITDRLHGHILCTLMNIPHVYIDNKQKKISNYHTTWTANVENIILANSSSDALVQAERLLKKLDKQSPGLGREFLNKW